MEAMYKKLEDSVAKAMYLAFKRDDVRYVGKYRFPGTYTYLDGDWDLNEIAQAAIKAVLEYIDNPNPVVD
jgi:hypothetical protein